MVVVGAGITGASLAFHLAARGQRVTLLDAGLPGSGATRSSFGWIGRPATSDLPSAPLRYLALDEYRRLERELPDLSIRWSGALVWGSVDDPGGGCTTPDVAALEPNLVDPPATALYRQEDAAFDPLAVTDLLVAPAIDGGPVIGPEPDVPGLYLAVMHSAVTLAAAVGRLASSEITTGVEAPELVGCRRARFGS